MRYLTYSYVVNLLLVVVIKRNLEKTVLFIHAHLYFYVYLDGAMRLEHDCYIDGCV